MKFGKNVLPVNRHQLIELDFRCGIVVPRWRPWRHFTKKA